MHVLFFYNDLSVHRPPGRWPFCPTGALYIKFVTFHNRRKGAFRIITFQDNNLVNALPVTINQALAHWRKCRWDTVVGLYTKGRASSAIERGKPFGESSRDNFKESLQLHRNEKMSDLKKICSLKFPTTFFSRRLKISSLQVSCHHPKFDFYISTKSLQVQQANSCNLSFIIHSTFSQHLSVSTPLSRFKIYNYNCTIILPFYNCKLHCTTAEIVISCTLKYGLESSAIFVKKTRPV